MENASKAMLIAGSVLLAMVIVGAGIFIFNSSMAVTQLSKVDALAIQLANNEFEQFEGRQRGVSVVRLLDKIIEYNKEYAKDESYSIGICSNDNRILDKISNANVRKVLAQNAAGRQSGVYWEDNIKSVKKAISNSQYFYISFDYNKLNGFIYIVHIDAA